MKLSRRILLIVFALMLVLPCAFASVPDYLQVDQIPLVTEPITLKIAVMAHDNTTDPTNTWEYLWLTQELGLNVELEYFYSASRNEAVSLMMAGGELPDIIMSAGFNASELVRYGDGEGLLLDLAPYLNEENAPNLTALFDERPALKKELSTSQGKIYSLGFVTDTNPSRSFRMFYNYDWLEKLDMEVPTTLDEFMDMLRTFKASADILGVDEVVPFGGNYARYNATYLIQNALGYNLSMNYSNQKSHETDIMLRNGEIVLPCYDREVFPTYIDILHTMHEEGLMEKDYYTLDKDTTKAHVAAGIYGVFSEVPGIYSSLEYGSEWFGGIPLTSEFNDTPFWPNYTGQTIGGFVVSAKTQYPEVCVALADHLFDPEYSDFFGYGPSVNQPEYFLGKTSGWFLDTNSFERITQTYLDNADQYSHFNYWRYENITCWYPATVGIEIGDGSVVVDENGKEYDISRKPTGDTLMEIARIRKECTSVDEQYSVSQRYSWGQYMTDEFSPTVCYFDEETTLRIDELKALITEHASHEIAKFVTGERDLSELDAYFDELQKLGADEYVKYYADYYEALNS